MKKEIIELKLKAEQERALYNRGELKLSELHAVKKYVGVVNAKSNELATKYNQKVKKVSMRYYLNSSY